MPTSPINQVIHYLRSTLLPEGADLTDGQLLEGFVTRRETAALEALVRRHAPMVWGVCRRVLGNHHDADAFQATFLVLVRKAASVYPRAKVGNWLYGVAHQTALKARATRTKRRGRERPATEMPEPAATPGDLRNDLQPLLDQEVSRLPEKYRAVIVLCELEGKTVGESARQLGCPAGTVASRLARGRAMLVKRLAQHGLGVTAGTWVSLMSQKAALASVPTSLLFPTIKAVTSIAAGHAAPTRITSGTVAALTEGVIKAMFLNKVVKLTMLLLVIVGLSSAAETIYQMQATEPPTDQQASQRPKPASVPAANKGVEENKHHVLTPEEAIKLRSNDKVTVEFTVQSVFIPLKPFQPGGKLSDRIDKRFFHLKHDSRFFVFMAGEAATQTYKLGIDPETYFSGKSVRATGEVLSYRNHVDGKVDYGIRIESIDRLQVVSK
jgi:RNA polymerase sigma factor (sigma-70 family)